MPSREKKKKKSSTWPAEPGTRAVGEGVGGGAFALALALALALAVGTVQLNACALLRSQIYLSKSTCPATPPMPFRIRKPPGPVAHHHLGLVRPGPILNSVALAE
eukprot:534298-Prymnesium_polylepis.1